ncbi:hypothetical protein PIROE2DRAFT_13360, partial [Piromyces sp. E2]
MLMPEFNENDILQKKNFKNNMATLMEEEENNEMNMDDNENKENNDTSMDVTMNTKVEVESSSPAIPKFNANNTITNNISSSSTNAYAQFNNNATQKYVFQSKVTSSFGQNSFSNVKKNNFHPLLNNKNGLNKNFSNLQNVHKNNTFNNRKFLSNNPLVNDSIIEEEEEEDQVPELPSKSTLDFMNVESPKKPISPPLNHTKIAFGNNNNFSNINKLINSPPNANTFPYNIKLNHPNINAGPFPHTFKNYKNTYANKNNYGNKMNLNFGSTSSLLNKLKANSFNKPTFTSIPDSP